MAVKSKKNVVSVPDLSEVESGYSNLPEGTYHLKVIKAEKGESQSGNEMITWDFEVVDGKQKGGKIRDYTSLSANALWKLKGYLAALGFEIPNGGFDLDLDSVIDEEVMGVVEHEEYEGKPRARLTDVYSIEEAETEEEEEVKPAKKGGKVSKVEKEDEEEESAPKRSSKKTSKKKIYTEDEIMELDEEGLGEVIEQEGLEVDLDEAPTIRKKRNAVIEALDAAKQLAAE